MIPNGKFFVKNGDPMACCGKKNTVCCCVAKDRIHHYRMTYQTGSVFCTKDYVNTRGNIERECLPSSDGNAWGNSRCSAPRYFKESGELNNLYPTGFKC